MELHVPKEMWSYESWNGRSCVDIIFTNLPVQFYLNINAINDACALLLRGDVEASIVLTRDALLLACRKRHTTRSNYSIRKPDWLRALQFKLIALSKNQDLIIPFVVSLSYYAYYIVICHY
ncbi:hypothetical protein GJ496_001585 [Pomphorhynchus laevis]|nr:hypothetical protein GJ496_001585 [Pomphorhynchus laevis]